MITFVFHKLVRDKLREEYVRMHQKATYRILDKAEHTQKLQQKILEEAAEIPLNGSREAIISELADVQQALDDLAFINTISPDEIAEAKQRKFDKKGGFTEGTYVETLELHDDDEWVAYYRKEPAIFKELPNK